MTIPTPAEMALWPRPNYINPTTVVPALKGVMITFTVLMLPFVITRVKMRLQTKGRLGTDDYIIIFASFLTVASTVLAIVSTKYGGGYLIWDVKPEWVPVFRKLGVAGVALFAVAVVLPKISVCFTYLLLFPARRNTVFCWIMIVFLTCWAISNILVTIFQCRPAASYWDVAITSEYCVNPAVFNIVTGVVNSMTDFVVYLWPVQFLWGIQIPVKQKLGVIFLFVIGICACIAGIVRIYYIHVQFHGYQYFYNGALIWTVSSVETNVGIIFTCMHAMRPILSKIVPSYFSNSDSRKLTPKLKTWTETSAPTGFGARLKSITSRFAGGNKTRPAKNSYDDSANDSSLASNMDFNASPSKDCIHAGPGKVNSLVTTGSDTNVPPGDSIMYDQRVVVVRESKE